MRTVQLTHDYPFAGLPEGRVAAGQSSSVMVSVFGRLPAQPYHMEVIAFDEAAMTLTSSERGADVKSWHHTIKVTPTPTGSRLTDTIKIDADWLTWAFTLWAKYLYGKRHQPRLRILERRNAVKTLR